VTRPAVQAAATDDLGPNPPFNDAIVGHDADTSGLHGNARSACCQWRARRKFFGGARTGHPGGAPDDMARVLMFWSVRGPPCCESRTS
jgi:hypothetical protein